MTALNTCFTSSTAARDDGGGHMHRSLKSDCGSTPHWHCRDRPSPGGQSAGALYDYQARTLNSDCLRREFDDPRIAEFEQGVCLFHKQGRSEKETATALDALRQAQVKGLPPVHQNFAALLSGLMNCHGAQESLERYKASNNKNEMERIKFCRNRRLSAADLGEVRWDRADFEYEASPRPDFSLNARLAEMGTCYVDVLDPAFDAQCELISNISDAEITRFVDEAVDKIITKYFAGAESPITAMFARKIARSEGLRESASAAIGQLRNSATEVNSKYEAFNTAYLDARDRKIAKAYDDYRNAILRANTILDEFNRWKDGLFITAQNENRRRRDQGKPFECDQGTRPRPAAWLCRDIHGSRRAGATGSSTPRRKPPRSPPSFAASITANSPTGVRWTRLFEPAVGRPSKQSALHRAR